MISDLKSAVKFIKEHNDLREIHVSKRVRDKIKRDLEGMQRLKPAPRPTYGPPYGDIDRYLWDGMQAMKKLAEIRLLGVLVVSP